MVPQLMTAGTRRLTASAVPAWVTNSGSVLRVKIAVTAVAAVIVKCKVPSALQPPLQHGERLSHRRVGFSVTVVPWLNVTRTWNRR